MASSIDINQLVQCFNMTLQNDQQMINSASEFLEKCKPMPGFPVSLIQVADNAEVSLVLIRIKFIFESLPPLI